MLKDYKFDTSKFVRLHFPVRPVRSDWLKKLEATATELANRLEMYADHQWPKHCRSNVHVRRMYELDMKHVRKLRELLAQK